MLARLDGAQKAISNGPNQFLIQLEKSLIDEYKLIMLQEEEYQALKSCLNWATYGDSNTSFFHVSMLVRRHRNKIRMLKNSVGEWITNKEGVKEYILSGFKEIFRMELLSSTFDLVALYSSYSSLTEEERTILAAPILEDEFRHGLSALKPFKAPRSDGLHVGFFQYFWNDVKKSVCMEVSKIFDSRVIPDFLNETLISLFPKCSSPESLSNFRPISICNTIYKVVTKIIVGRIRPFLDKLISPNQTAFVPGRWGLDNVVVAQELIHSLDKKKGRVGFMAIKVDLVKAYDCLEWSFIRKILQVFCFPNEIIKLIMSCVSTTTISILINGGKSSSFKPTRGIRQGDPFSPYFFILCMEYLGFLINECCRMKDWIPLKASRQSLGVSHLFLIDNLMLFAKANKASDESIKKALSIFYKESGQLVSAEKSCIYFSPNVPPNIREDIYGVLDIAENSNIGKYLGFLLNHKGAAWNRYNFVVDRVISKLSGWKSKFLSFAGRTVLVKSVMVAIPNYVMQGCFAKPCM